VVVPTKQLGYIHLKENSILSSGFTQKHIYKSAKDLTVEIKGLKCGLEPRIYGRRDDEWLLVEVGDVAVHFFVNTFRKETDLLQVWLNPPSEEVLEQRRKEQSRLKKY
jgi:ribosomal silencing factor RsfS